MSPTCGCLKRAVKGQMCFLLGHMLLITWAHPYFILDIHIIWCVHAFLQPWPTSSVTAFYFSAQNLCGLAYYVPDVFIGLFPSGSLGSQGGSVWDQHSEFPVMSPDSGFMMLSLPLTEGWVCQTVISMLKLLPATLFGRLPVPAFCEASRWTYLNFMVGEMYSWNLNFCLDVAHWSLGFYGNLKHIQ